MSGHSKWATIHRKKGLIDAQRGKLFQKLAKEIMVAAKGTDGNIDNNAALRMVVEKCRSQNMPKENIQKAIDKATGSSDSVNFESIRYEGYGPNGIAIMVDCLTDNKNRTAGMVRSTFTKHGGNLGTDGSVSYMFNRQGLIVIDKTLDEEDVMMTALDAGALDVITLDEAYEIYTSPDDFLLVKKALDDLGSSFLSAEVTYIPNSDVTVDEETKEKFYKLIDTLEEIDDVQDIYHNLSE